MYKTLKESAKKSLQKIDQNGICSYPDEIEGLSGGIKEVKLLIF